MATELGKAYVQIMPSAKGISGMISKELGGESARAGKIAGSNIVGAIKGVFVVAGIGAALSKTLTEGGELQQSLGGIETLYKEHADKVKKYASESYKTTGLSANEYMKTTTMFSASLLQSLAGDTNKAADFANQALIDMSDNSNKFGTSIQSIQDAYRGFAKQNYTMLDNLSLGYGGTKTEMERLLADAQKLTGVKYDISNLNDVYSAIHVIQGELGITGTTAKEASSTLQGSFASMKASFNDVLGNMALGNDITLQLQALATTTSTFLFQNLLPMLGNIFTALPGAIITFVQTSIPLILTAGQNLISQFLNGFNTGLPQLLTKGTEIINSLIASVTENLPTVLQKGSEIVSNIVDGITAALPNLTTNGLDLITSIVNGITENLPTIYNNGLEIVTNIANGILKKIPDIGQTVLDMVQKMLTYLADNMPGFLKSGSEMILSMLSGLREKAPELLGNMLDTVIQLIKKIAENLPGFLKKGGEIILSIISGLIEYGPKILLEIGGIVLDLIGEITSRIPDFLDAGADIVSGVWEGIVGMKDTLIKNVKGFFQDVLDTAKNILDIHSPSKVFQDEVGAMIPLGTAKGIQKTQSKATKAAQEMSESILNKAKEWVDEKKFYDQLSLSDELAFWNDLKSIKGLQAQQVKEIDKTIYSARKALQEQENEATKKLLDEQKRAFDEYTNNINSRSQALEGFAGLFDLIEKKNEVSGQQLLTNLKSQVEAFKSWQGDLRSLSNRGISESLLSELRQMGPKSAEEIHALTTLSDVALSEYVALFAEKTKLAREQAEAELGKFVFKPGDELVESGKNEALTATSTKMVDTLKEGLTSNMPKISEVGGDTVKTYITRIESKMQDVRNTGRMLTDGLWQGIESGKSGLIANVQSMLDEMVARARAAMQINSPSKVWAEIGQFMAAGLGVGFIREMKSVTGDISGSLPNGESVNSLGYRLNRLSKGYDSSPNGANVNGAITVNQNIYSPQTDERAQQKEAARQLRYVMGGI